MSTPFSQPISPFLPPLGSIHISVCSLCCVSISGFWTVFSFCIITPVSDFPFTWCPTCVCVCLQTLPLYKSYWIRDPPYFLTYLITSRGTLSHVLGCIQLFVTLWTVAHQAPPSMGFSRQEYWGALPCPPPGASRPRDRTQSLMKGIAILEEILDFLGFGLSWKAVVCFLTRTSSPVLLACPHMRQLPQLTLGAQ